MGERPGRLAVVTGTGTEVGKTWVASRLLQEARADGAVVAARKPVQSYEPAASTTDAEVLAEASGEAPETVCPRHRWYPMAVAPFMAAERLGQPPFTLAGLVDELQWPPGVDLGVVEGVGGVRSPITNDDADTVDLARAVGADTVVLVADAGLGTLNAVRLAHAALAGLPLVVVLNRFDATDDLHQANHLWLCDHLDAPILAGAENLWPQILD